MKSNPHQRLSLSASYVATGLFAAGITVVCLFPVTTMLIGGIGTAFYLATDPEGRLKKIAFIVRQALPLGAEAGRNVLGHLLSKGIEFVQKRIVREPVPPPAPPLHSWEDPHAHVWKAATWRGLFNGVSRRVDEKLKKSPAPGQNPGPKPPSA